MSSPGGPPSARKPPARPCASSSLANVAHSPGGFKSPENPGKAGLLAANANNSPFREWATCNLSAFGNDIVWPANSSRSILSPSYPHMREKINEAESSPLAVSSRVDSLIGRSLPVEHASPLCLNQVFKEHQDDRMDTLQAGVMKQSIASSDARIPKLELTTLVTFELCEKDNKVITSGFMNPAPTWTRSKRQVGVVPTTPALQTAVTSKTATANEQFSGGIQQSKVCCCKKSKCLKLYCECFSAGVMCSTCKCADCANDGNHEEERLKAVKSITQRNVNAFAPKIVDDRVVEEKGMHARGCRCKKSHCLKKYCECFQAGVECADKCKCEECQNFGNFDGTPRDRPAESLGIRPSSAGSDPSDGDAGQDTERMSSPRRNKKPRMLDFSVLSTPSVAKQNSAVEESPMQDCTQRPTGLMFASPLASV